LVYEVDLQKIKEIRKRKRIKQREIAEKLGYQSCVSYHRLETGCCEIKAKQLPVIASILGVSIGDLYIAAEGVCEIPGCNRPVFGEPPEEKRGLKEKENRGKQSLPAAINAARRRTRFLRRRRKTIPRKPP